MADTALDFLLENMMQLISCNNPLMFCLDKEQMVCIYEEMQFLRKFLIDSLKARSEHEEVRDLVAKISNLTCEIDDIIGSFILRAFVQREASKRGVFSIKDIKTKLRHRKFKPLFHALSGVGHGKFIHMKDIKSFADKRIGHGFGGVVKEINSIKTKVREIYAKNMYGMGAPKAPKPSHGVSASSRATSPVVEEETVVGMDDAIISIIEQLTAEHERHLKVIPIIGMPGLGKTTLARKVYNDPFVIYHFHVLAWTCVSQEYQKGDLLRSILSSAQLIQSHCSEIDKKGDQELGEKLYKGLRGIKYLIIMDDVWDIEVWNDLKKYLPDDNNGSRVVFTSRHVDVAVHTRPHYLRFLNEKESWDLLRMKVFRKESCPSELIGMGEKIAKKCQGLPLAILVVSGLLVKSEKTLDWWTHVANSVSSYIISEPEQYMATLGLSYNQLPYHLKPCFLYFGAFPEDYEIPVQNLFWLWIAEGFILKNEHKSLEDIAEDYLMDLVERGLVSVSKQRCDGRIKQCRIHDLLRDLCLRIAEEENFLVLIPRFEHIFPSPSSSHHTVNKHRRISLQSQVFISLQSQFQCYQYLKSHGLHVRSFLAFFQHAPPKLPLPYLTSICLEFKLLRVLNISSITMSLFPYGIEFLVHLRYLAIRAWHGKASISNLFNLQTLIVKGFDMRIKLGDDIWKMARLRHLNIWPQFKIPPPPEHG